MAMSPWLMQEADNTGQQILTDIHSYVGILLATPRLGRHLISQPSLNYAAIQTLLRS